MRFDFAAMGPAAGTSELRIEPPQQTPLFLTIFCLDIVRITSTRGAYSRFQEHMGSHDHRCDCAHGARCADDRSSHDGRRRRSMPISGGAFGKGVECICYNSFGYKGLDVVFPLALSSPSI